MAVAYNIFPLTIYHTSISDNDYLKELLVPKIKKAIPELEIPKHWATDNLRTSFESEPKGNEIFTKENNSILTDHYNEAITELFDKEVAWEIVNGIWYNYYEKNSYQERHEHIASPFEKIHFSCVHYLSYDKEVHTATEFRDPISALRAHSLTLDRDFVGDYFMPTVEEGDLIMFPAYLEHRIFPQKVSDTPRITLSFNFEVTKYG